MSNIAATNYNTIAIIVSTLILIISIFIAIYRKNKSGKIKQNQKSGNNSKNYQSAGNIIINSDKWWKEVNDYQSI